MPGLWVERQVWSQQAASLGGWAAEASSPFQAVSAFGIRNGPSSHAVLGPPPPKKNCLSAAACLILLIGAATPSSPRSYLDKAPTTPRVECPGPSKWYEASSGSWAAAREKTKCDLGGQG